MVISAGHKAEMVARHFDRQPVNGAVVQYVAESRLLEAAGGFLNAIRGVNEKPAAWLVLNGDSLAPDLKIFYLNYPNQFHSGLLQQMLANIRGDKPVAPVIKIFASICRILNGLNGVFGTKRIHLESFQLMFYEYQPK